MREYQRKRYHKRGQRRLHRYYNEKNDLTQISGYAGTTRNQKKISKNLETRTPHFQSIFKANVNKQTKRNLETIKELRETAHGKNMLDTLKDFTPETQKALIFDGIELDKREKELKEAK